MADEKSDDAASGPQVKEEVAENIELEEKEKAEKEQLLNEEDKSKEKKSPSHRSEEDSPISKAFFLSKYITFW